MNKSEVLTWLYRELSDHDYMQSTINTLHPTYKGSDDERAYKNHEHSMMVIEYLMRLVEQQANP